MPFPHLEYTEEGACWKGGEYKIDLEVCPYRAFKKIWYQTFGYRDSESRKSVWVRDKHLGGILSTGFMRRHKEEYKCKKNREATTEPSKTRACEGRC